MDLESYASLGKFLSAAFFGLALVIVTRLIWKFIISPEFFGYSWQVDKNSWAIITGATDGIGLEFARQLAEKGYNLCLISRNPEKLERTRKSILEQFPDCPSIELVTHEFSSKNYRSIEETLKNYPKIDVLVNNVGILPVDGLDPHWFLEVDYKMIEKVVNVNIGSCLKMTHIVLPIMERQKSGLIINLSSLSGRKPTPLLQFYGATKVFVDFFSRSLAIECKKKGILVQSLIPGFIQTNMVRMKTNAFVPSAKQYVKSALKVVGMSSRSTGSLVHELAFTPMMLESYVSLRSNAIDQIGTKYLASLTSKNRTLQDDAAFSNDVSSLIAARLNPFRFD